MNVREILLNPGPVTLSETVRQAAMRADLCHREPEFFNVQREVIDGLSGVYEGAPGAWTTVTLGGSGTIAMEAMLSSLVPERSRLLVLENGVYGERLSKIARVHGIAHQAISQAWGAAPDLDAIDRTLASGEFSHLAMVHHETTTGRLNPVQAVADLCTRHDVSLLLDAVSSYAAESIPLDHPALAACAATANKCLHGIPGLAFVLLRAELLEAPMPERSLYLHLPSWAAAQARDSTPFTPPVNAFLALQQALRELRAQGGWQARHGRYTELAERVRASLAARGVEPWLPPGESSCALRSYRLPAGLNYNHVHDGFKRHGFVIYAGQGGLSDSMFRISTMGDITDADIERLDTAIDDVFE
jgi:2-aminoethylphosphonate-pyruvate transaminase